MKSIVMTLSLILVTLQARSYEIDQVKESLLEKAIIKKDFSQFTELLGDSDKSKTKGHISKGFGHYLLGLATSPKNWHHSRKKQNYFCSPSMVNFLIEKGAVPNSQLSLTSVNLKEAHLAGAIENLCPNSVKALTFKLPQEEVAKATRDFKLTELSHLSNDKEMVPRILATFKELKDFNQKNCTNQNSNCQAVTFLNSELTKFAENEKRREQKREFYKTKEGSKQLVVEKACFHHQQYLNYMSKIKEEREKGKISGYVNAVQLKEWGDYAYTEKKKKELILENAGFKNTSSYRCPN